MQWPILWSSWLSFFEELLGKKLVERSLKSSHLWLLWKNPNRCFDVIAPLNPCWLFPHISSSLILGCCFRVVAFLSAVRLLLSNSQDLQGVSLNIPAFLIYVSGSSAGAHSHSLRRWHPCLYALSVAVCLIMPFSFLGTGAAPKWEWSEHWLKPASLWIWSEEHLLVPSWVPCTPKSAATIRWGSKPGSGPW